MFMALDESGRVRTSPDGIAWLPPVNIGAQRICFAHDRFFGMSDNGDVRSSTEGLTWTPVTGIGVLNSVVLQQVIWHLDRFLALGGPDAVLLTSPDAATWTRVPIATSGTLFSALSTAGGLVVAGVEQSLLYSANPLVPPVSPPAPTITITGNPAPNVFTFTLSASPGQVVTLESSANLQQWTTVQTFTLSGGAESLEITAPNARSADFFRLSWAQP